jgi:replicative DNA helicase
MQALRDLELAGYLAYTKFIPRCYKYASLSQRIDLLQGLLDTDGCVRKEDNTIEFATSSSQLALDMKELVQSLGGKASLRSRIPHYSC